MRKYPLLVGATVLAAVTVVALASAAQKKGPESWLPQGVTAAGANWLSGEGDESNSRFSTLRQINSNNVQNLHVVWNQQFNPTSIAFSPEGQPTCCPNDLLYQTYIQGVAAMKPDTGDIAWNYKGPETAQLTQAGQRLRADNARTQSYSPKLNMIYSGQQDGSIVALNAKTGAPVWTTSVIGAGTYGDATGAESEPFTQFYDVQGTNGVVISAPNGGESPFRGHIDAFDARPASSCGGRGTCRIPRRCRTSSRGATRPRPLSAAPPFGRSRPSIPSSGPCSTAQGTRSRRRTARRGGASGRRSVMAVDWKTGALKWFFQATQHDWLDFDLPHPPMVLRVPIDGKMTPVVAEGSKGGFFYVLNAKNGGAVKHFKITETPTYDPSGKGIALNNLAKTQPFPSGASFCMAVVDYSPEGLAKCNWPGNPLVDKYGGSGTVSSPTTIINTSNGFPIHGAPESAAHYYGEYLTYGGAGGGGIFGYPPSAYSPLTHTYYACLMNESGAHTNQGPNTPNVSTIGGPTTSGLRAS